MRTIPMKEDLIVEFKSDIKRYSDSELIDVHITVHITVILLENKLILFQVWNIIL